MSILFTKIKNEKGSSLVEFSLIVGLLLLIFFGITEFARAWYRADRLKNAANIAARTYAVTSGDSATKTSAAQEAARIVIPTLTDSDISPDTTIAEQVTVTVRESFQTVVPGFLPVLGNITSLRRDATYRLEQ